MTLDKEIKLIQEIEWYAKKKKVLMAHCETEIRKRHKQLKDMYKKRGETKFGTTMNLKVSKES